MTPDDMTARELADRIDAATLGLFDIATIYVGDRLAFYGVLGSTDWITPGDLAAATGTHERFAREWCEQQAAVGILACDDPAAGPDARRFLLPEGYRAVLADRDDPAFVAGGLPGLVAALAVLGDLPDLVRMNPVPPRHGHRGGGGARRARRVEPAVVPAPDGGLAGLAARRPCPSRRIPPARVLDVACGAVGQPRHRHCLPGCPGRRDRPRRDRDRPGASPRGRGRPG